MYDFCRGVFESCFFKKQILRVGIFSSNFIFYDIREGFCNVFDLVDG